MRLRGLALLLTSGSLLSCDLGADRESRSVSPPPVPEVEYSRCQAVHFPGPVCALWPSRRLNLWVKDSPGGKVEIRAGGQPLKVEGEEVKGGWLYRLSIPSTTSLLEVSLRSPEGVLGSGWSLRLAQGQVPAWLEEIDQLGSSGRTEEVRRRLADLRKMAPRPEQGLVLRSLAELARRDGNDVERELYLRQGLAVDRAENCWSCEVEKATWLARLYRDQGRFSEARQTLAALRFPPKAPAESKYLAAYYQGLLADQVGNYRLALVQLRKAAGLAERTGMIQYRWKAEQTLARVLQDLGRSREASDLFARLRSELGKDLRTDPHIETPCDVGLLLMNWAWSRLLQREAGEDAGDPAPMLKEAQAEFDSHHCPVDQRLDARLNLALAHQQAGRWQEARQALEQAASLASRANLRQRLWWHDLEARAEMARGGGAGAARALRLYNDLEALAERALSFEGRFRALLGRARAELALGRREAALATLAESDALIDEQIWFVPAYEGRDTLVSQREAATRLYLELLLEEGHRRRAFDLVRRARSRLLRQLAVRDRLTQLTPAEQREWDRALASYQALRNAIDQEAAQEWQLPGDQVTRARENRTAQLARAREDLDRALAGLGNPGIEGERGLLPPRPGEVVLAYHPLTGGWVGFAAHEQGIEVSTFDPPAPTDSGAQARNLLEPFHRVLAPAERVRVLPYGPLRSIDFHTLPFGGEPLLARHLVVYGLDLPARPEPPPPGRRVALLVTDPQGDLPEARREAETVAAAIRSWGQDWILKRLDSTNAQAGAVRAALPGAALFHYAGHGTFAGFSGWDSVLTLADGTRLTLGDILALHPAPAWVVLSSCDAGRSSEQAPGEGIGLAHAFLLAGSQAVVAATRKVPDQTARDLLGELYHGWQPGMDLPRQFQRAQWTCLQRHPAADCASFRLFEP